MCKYSTRVLIHTLDVVINGEEAEKEAAEISVNSDDGSCHHSELLFTMIYSHKCHNKESSFTIS